MRDSGIYRSDAMDDLDELHFINALAAWLRSQGYQPNDATRAMLRMIGSTIGGHATNDDDFGQRLGRAQNALLSAAIFAYSFNEHRRKMSESMAKGGELVDILRRLVSDNRSEVDFNRAADLLNRIDASR